MRGLTLKQQRTMTQQQALANIGQPFKSMIEGARWDVIVSVSDYVITGNHTIAPVEHCRLKQPIPLQLQRAPRMAKQFIKTKLNPDDSNT